MPAKPTLKHSQVVRPSENMKKNLTCSGAKLQTISWPELLTGKGTQWSGVKTCKECLPCPPGLESAQGQHRGRNTFKLWLDLNNSQQTCWIKEGMVSLEHIGDHWKNITSYVSKYGHYIIKFSLARIIFSECLVQLLPCEQQQFAIVPPS